ncbi:MAG: mechanosensitive ion channel [Rikenellaceae bacterium]|jgi:small conductance mechanosensitive channel|nr:mechanosensitive ion channel [Rikenellaceae bacterium]
MPLIPLPADSSAVERAEDIQRTFIQKMESISNMSVQELIEAIAHSTINILLKIILALAVFYAGRWVIRRIRRWISRIMERREVDLSLRTFLLSLTHISLMVILIYMIVGILGINTTSFVALFASAGLAIGMALSGTLQNFAGGIMVLLQKPFRVGDYIEAQGQAGTVKEIRLFNTVLNTSDNKTITVPNGGLSTGIINNYSREENRRVEWIFGISYGNDYDRAKTLIAEMLEHDERILYVPEPFIGLHALAGSSVNIVVRAWVGRDDYWDVYFDLNEKVYKAFPPAGLNIPFPQMDVHVHQGSPQKEIEPD